MITLKETKKNFGFAVRTLHPLQAWETRNIEIKIKTKSWEAHMLIRITTTKQIEIQAASLILQCSQ
jgi:hypothetical protein